MNKKKLLLLLSIVFVLMFSLSACNFDAFKDAFKDVIEDPINPFEYDDILQPDELQKRTIVPHLISSDEVDAEPYRYIRDNPNVKTVLVSTINELYGCLSSGYRPKFADNTSNAYKTYQEILKVLDRIIVNTMTEYERAHAIYDFIIFCTEYDYALYDKYKENPSSVLNSDPSFHITGVFLKRIAVCDGLSKAFAVMCMIENIKCIQVTGNNGDVGHAWNKLFIHKPDYSDCTTVHDENCDSQHFECSQMLCDDASHRAWYLVDTTSGNIYATKGSEKVELLIHAFFLISDTNELVSSYVEDAKFPQAIDEYDYYSNTHIYNKSEQAISLYVQNIAELEALAVAIVQNKLSSCEIKFANASLASSLSSSLRKAGNYKDYAIYGIGNYYILC